MYGGQTTYLKFRLVYTYVWEFIILAGKVYSQFFTGIQSMKLKLVDFISEGEQNYMSVRINSLYWEMFGFTTGSGYVQRFTVGVWEPMYYMEGKVWKKSLCLDLYLLLTEE